MLLSVFTWWQWGTLVYVVLFCYSPGHRYYIIIQIIHSKCHYTHYHTLYRQNRLHKPCLARPQTSNIPIKTIDWLFSRGLSDSVTLWFYYRIVVSFSLLLLIDKVELGRKSIPPPTTHPIQLKLGLSKAILTLLTTEKWDGLCDNCDVAWLVALLCVCFIRYINTFCPTTQSDIV